MQYSKDVSSTWIPPKSLQYLVLNNIGVYFDFQVLSYKEGGKNPCSNNYTQHNNNGKKTLNNKMQTITNR